MPRAHTTFLVDEMKRWLNIKKCWPAGVYDAHDEAKGLKQAYKKTIRAKEVESTSKVDSSYAIIKMVLAKLALVGSFFVLMEFSK
jgi:hypothetical protein